MGKLRVLSGKEVCVILKRHEFVEVRQRGSYVVMQKRLADTTVTVPVPNPHGIEDWHTSIHHSPVGHISGRVRIMNKR